MKSKKGIHVNKQELADIFGVNTTTVDIWVRKGCPVVTKGTRGIPWELNTAEIYEWRKNRAIEQNQKTDNTVTCDNKELDIKVKQEKYRLTKYQANEQKVKSELAEKKVIAVDIVDTSLANLFALIRDKVLSVPSRVELDLLGETDSIAFNEILTKEIKEALHEVCDGADETRDKILEDGIEDE